MSFKYMWCKHFDLPASGWEKNCPIKCLIHLIENDTFCLFIGQDFFRLIHIDCKFQRNFHPIDRKMLVLKILK